MKRKLLFILLFNCLSFIANAQLSPSHKEKLALLITEKVNVLRISKGQSPLRRDINLMKAAQLHSDYMVKTQRLSHKEYGEGTYESPRDRVEVYSVLYVAVGENILYTKPIRNSPDEQFLKKIATDMFRSWKNSPGHYSNMISPEYDHGDFAFKYDPTSKRIYATHVLGRKGYAIAGQASKNAFGIQFFEGGCTSLFDGLENIVTNMGNAVEIEGNKIVLRYHDIQRVRDIITDAKDGIAVDLIDRTQFTCGSPSQLDASSIYDGVLLKPIYRDALFANNKAKSDFRFVVTLANIPEHLQGKDIKPSLIFIKNGRKCAYVSSRILPSGRYPLERIEPLIFEPKIPLVTKGIKEVQELIYTFDTDEIVPEELPRIRIYSDQLHTAEVQSYSSVNGSSKGNATLHRERASFMQSHIKAQLKSINIPWKIKAEENWSLCEYQMELNGQDDIWLKGKGEVRNYINTQVGNDDIWDMFLSQQRVSKAVLYWSGNWNSNDTLHAQYNLVDALIREDMPRANKALALMYKSKNIKPLPLSFLKKRLFAEEALVQNVSALILKNIDIYNLNDIVYYVRTWLLKAEELSEEAQQNLLNLYAITSGEMLDEWDLSSERLSRVMHPIKLEKLFENYKSDDIVNPLFLNFHMAIIRYYGQINDSSKIGISFDFITNYFREKSLTIMDDRNLALFFNSWSRYDLTIELLVEDYKEGILDENTLFLLLQTRLAYSYGEEIPLEELNKIALQKNKRRWCSWINLDFENLRDNRIKGLFCNECPELSIEQLLKDQN